MLSKFTRTRKLLLSFLLTAVMALSVLPTIGCGNGSVRDFKVDLNKAAATLNAAAKENRTLYQLRVFGDKALEVRRKTATVIHAANEGVISALDIAKKMTEQTLAVDKTLILTLLRQATIDLASGHIGNPKIDLLLQAAAATINTAITFVEALSHADLQVPQRFIRAVLNKQLAKLAAVREMSLADMGGY